MPEYDQRTADELALAQNEMRKNGATQEAYDLLDRALFFWRLRKLVPQS